MAAIVGIWVLGSLSLASTLPLEIFSAADPDADATNKA